MILYLKTSLSDQKRLLIYKDAGVFDQNKEQMTKILKKSRALFFVFRI